MVQKRDVREIFPPMQSHADKVHGLFVFFYLKMCKNALNRRDYQNKVEYLPTVGEDAHASVPYQ